MLANLIITSIKPTDASVSYAEKHFRSKEGEAKKASLFAVYSIPIEFDSLLSSDLKGFCLRAYQEAMNVALDDAVKANKESFPAPSLADCFVAAKREFLLTKASLMPWVDFVLPIISAAIATKANLHIDSPKILKKALAYKETLLSLTSRAIMKQEEIDACLKVCSLLEDTGKSHAYTDNVLQGIARAQAKLDAFLAGDADDTDDDLDF